MNVKCVCSLILDKYEKLIKKLVACIFVLADNGIMHVL